MTVRSEYPTTRVSQTFWLLALVLLAGNALLALNWTRWTGEVLPEWPLAGDLLLLLPAAYAWVHRKRGLKASLGGAAALFGFGVLAGSWLLPEGSKQIWAWLEALRWPVIGLVVALQLLLLAGIVRTAWRQRDGRPFEDSVRQGLEHKLGDASAISRLLALESRLWIYALLRRPVPAGFPGTAHFSVHTQGGNASNQAAFLVLVGAEIPLLHLLLHFLWSPSAALVMTVLSLYGWLFLWAEYRATRLRPVSIDGGLLRIRQGITVDWIVPLDRIVTAQSFRGTWARAAGRLRAHGMGQPNVRLILRPGTRIATAFGTPLVNEVLLGVDTPAALLAALAQPGHGLGEARP